MQAVGIGLVLGVSLIVLGSVPGLLPRLLHGLQEGIENFLLFGEAFPRRSQTPALEKRIAGQGWFVLGGVVLVALAIVRLLSL